MPTNTTYRAAAIVCLVVVLVLTALVVGDWEPLQRLDAWVGGPAESLTTHHRSLLGFLLDVEGVFGTLGSLAYTVLIVLGLLVTGRRRAGWWAACVAVGAYVTTVLLKIVIQRDRPVWIDPVHALSSYAFPSGHATQIAAGMGVVIVLTALYCPRVGLRHGIFTGAGCLVVLVGADRVLLGVHHLSDVLAGYAVGAFWVFAMLAVSPPVASHTADATAVVERAEANRSHS